MKRLAAMAVAVLALTPALARADAADNDALLRFGLIGNWALDCQAPPYRQGFIDKAQLLALAKLAAKSNYGRYLLRLAQEE
jgi:hypothetical protein